VRNILKLPLLITAVVLADAASASTTTDSMAVTATVTASCHIAAGSALAFGSYDASTNTNVDGTATISTTCTNTTTYDIGLDAGLKSGATVSTREMNDGGTNYLPYSLYSDAGRTTNWGDTVSTDTVAKTGTGTAQTTTVYGRIPANTSAVPGSYTDTVTITVTY